MFPVYIFQSRVVTPPAEPECGHNAGQELCYLCHQRAARNIPVLFDEEKKKREAEEDQILHEFQIMKNNEFVLKEQVTLNLSLQNHARSGCSNTLGAVFFC